MTLVKFRKAANVGFRCYRIGETAAIADSDARRLSISGIVEVVEPEKQTPRLATIKPAAPEVAKAPKDQRKAQQQRRTLWP